MNERTPLRNLSQSSNSPYSTLVLLLLSSLLLLLLLLPPRTVGRVDIPTGFVVIRFGFALVTPVSSPIFFPFFVFSSFNSLFICVFEWLRTYYFDPSRVSQPLSPRLFFPFEVITRRFILPTTTRRRKREPLYSHRSFNGLGRNQYWVAGSLYRFLKENFLYLSFQFATAERSDESGKTRSW